MRSRGFILVELLVVIPIYAADHNGELLDPLFSGQKALAGTASTGRLTHHLAPYIGAESKKSGEVLEFMTFSWQKSEKTLNASCFIMPRRIDAEIAAKPANRNRIEPWGYPQASQPIKMAALISRIEPSRQSAMSDLDQLPTYVGNA